MTRLPLLLLLAACTPMPKLHFNEPPSAPAVHIEPASPVTTDVLLAVVDDEAVDPEGDDISYTYSWTVNGSPYASIAKSIDPSETRRGEIWAVTVSATDGEWDGETAAASVTVLNSAPVLDSVSISPTAPATTDDLVLDADGADADDDPLTWLIDWSRDGVVDDTFRNTLTVPASATGTHEEWSATVTPYDGYVEGTPMEVATYVDNTAPTMTGVSLLPSSPRVGDTIRASVADLTDPDDQTLSVTFTWYVNGVEAGTEVSSTGDVYLSGAFVKGDSVTVSAVASDGYASTDVYTSDALTVANTEPVLGGVTLTPTTGYESTTFECIPDTATDEDGDRVSYGYDWYVNGAAITSSASTLSGDDFVKGDEIYCVVTPSDVDDAGDPVTSDTADVLNSLPTITSVSLSPTSPTVAQRINASITGGSDADGDSISYTYYWEVNGTHVGTSSNQLENTLFVRGDVVDLTVTPSDGTAGTPVSATSTTVVNAVPTLSSASITPSTAYTDDTLTVTTSGYYDADGDAATYTYQWYRDSVALTGETSSTLSASLTTRGQRFYCAVTPDDGYDAGTPRSSSTLTISNSPPDTVADALSGVTATECDVVELDASGSDDLDGDTLTYTWNVTSKPSGSLASSSSFSSSTAESPTFVVDAAGTFNFQVTASDTYNSVADSVSVLVYDKADNTVPVASAGSDDTESAYATCSGSGSSHTCSPCSGFAFALDASGSYDDDGDPLHYTWSTSSGYASLNSSTSATPTLTFGNVPASYGVTTTYTATVALRVVDCAEDVDTDYVTLTYECTGI